MSSEHENEPDPLASLLQPLVLETWQDQAHRQSLRSELEAQPPPRSRWTLVLSALAGAVVAAVLLAATGGMKCLQRAFGIEVTDVERDAQGNIQRIILRTDGATELELRPSRDTEDFADPVVVTLPRRDGGEVRLRVLRDHDLGVLPRFVPAPDDGPAEMRTGARYALREVPCAWTVAIDESALTLRAADGDRRCVLPRIPTPSGTLPRYGDSRGLVEVLDS